MKHRASAMLAALALFACTNEASDDPQTPEQKERLALLTGLPLVFPAQFSLEQAGSPALSALEQDWQVEAIGAASAASLAPHKVLLMAHAPVQTADGLVALDEWVRAGGRLLLLADPKLDWPSDLPLGDRRRPIPFFADTGLLGHWGAVLHGPVADGPVDVKVGERTIGASSPGRFVTEGDDCSLDSDGFIARCRIGEGIVTLVADADFLDADDAGADELGFIRDELAALASDS